MKLISDGVGNKNASHSLGGAADACGSLRVAQCALSTFHSHKELNLLLLRSKYSTKI